VQRALGLLFCCVLSLVSSSPAVVAADAEELIRRGVELRRKEKDADALTLFQQAYEVSRAPKALAQIGLAEQALGKWGAADRHLRAALQAEGDAWVLKHRKAIEDAMQAIAAHVGRLEVRGSPAGAEVRVDGELIGKLPLPAAFAVTAGGVAIDVRAEGYVTIMRASTVPNGMLIRETFELQPVPQAMVAQASPPPTASVATTSRPSDDRLQALSEPPASSVSARPAVAPEEHSMRPTVALVLTALAVGATAVGVVEHVTWQSKTSDFNRTDGCDPKATLHGSSRCDHLWADAVNARLGAFIGYGVGAGLLTTAAILYFTAPSSGSSGGRQVACAVNPAQVGAGCSIRF
jgi:hypothetical protein